MLKTAIVVALLAVAVMSFIIANPMLFGFDTGVPHEKWFVYPEHFNLDAELLRLASQLGDDFKDDFYPYRNHCLRVLTFTEYFLPSFVEEEIPTAMVIAAMAIAYHDIALWTDGVLDYLEPSAVKMEHHAKEEDIYSEQQVHIARLIITEHHKLTDFSSEEESAAVQALVNAVRKADWADFTMGIIRWGLTAPLLEAAYAKHPDLGFHRLLTQMGGRLSPDSLLGQLEVLRIFKW